MYNFSQKSTTFESNQQFSVRNKLRSFCMIYTLISDKKNTSFKNYKKICSKYTSKYAFITPFGHSNPFLIG